ncbi:MAG: hypothetical protein NC118_05925 [Eubacterium sp.]|nr:hypothetical protein [Eubacterium sp.]
MQISLESKFIIYGAGTRGVEYYKVITRNNMTVVAFVDKNASKIQYVDDIPVYELKDIESFPFSKQEIIWVISISNVFTHYDIAKNLFDRGYQYIIYKELTENSLYGKEINKLYQAISIPYNNTKLNELEIPSFKIKQASTAEVNKSQFITKSVPIELLFGLSKEFYLSVAEKKNPKMIELIPDKSLLYFTINKDMMRFFLHTVTDAEWNDYINLYFEQRRGMIRENSIDLKEEENHLKDRYLIFQNMELLYNTNINFFYDNPVEVQWNPKGYFNIQDGNNRAAFLLAKGWNTIPCHISYDDYKIWVNEKKVAEVHKCLSRIERVEYPISNPSFSHILPKLMPYCYLKLRKLSEWLYKNKVKITDSCVLDIGCKNGFMGQYFVRMGAKVTAIESNDLSRQLCKHVNDLLYIKEEIVSDYKDLVQEQYDLVLLPLWEINDLSKILDYVKRILIIETTEPETLFSNTFLTKYFTGEKLCHYFCENRIIYTIIFTKQ